jgi:hypothetical protein
LLLVAPPDDQACPVQPAGANEMCRSRIVTGALTVALVDVGLGHPVPQAAIADAEIGGDLRDGLLAQARQLHGALTELRRVGSGHLDILPAATMVASGSMSSNPGKLSVK